jgi:protein required for attachment to host cells
MTITHDTLVLVADGRKALFLRNHGDERRIDLRTAAHREREDRKDSEIKTAPAGQSPAPAGTGLSGDTMEEPDFHRQEEERFARDLAEQVKATMTHCSSLRPHARWECFAPCGTRKRRRGSSASRSRK